MTKEFTPGVYPDNVAECHQMLSLVEAMLGFEQQRLAAVELLSEPTFKAADEITRLNAENAGLFAQLSATFDEKETLRLLVDEMVEGIENRLRLFTAEAARIEAEGDKSDPPYDAGHVQGLRYAALALSSTGAFVKARALITKASRDSGHG